MTFRRRLNTTTLVLVDLLASGPVIGVLWVLLLTARAYANDNNQILGVKGTEALVEIAKTRFAGDVQALTASLVGVAIGLGAFVGIVAESLVHIRTAFRQMVSPDLLTSKPKSQQSRGRLLLTRVALRLMFVVLVHGGLVMFEATKAPQLYTESLYARTGTFGPIARTVQILATDQLGTTGVAMVFLALLVALTIKIPSRKIAANALQSLWRRGHLMGGVLLLLAGGSILVGSVVLAPKKVTRRGGPPNILILAVDSLRDDKVTPGIAPNLSALSKSGTGATFANAYVTLPRTLPSWTTILTGREPHRHGLRTMFPRYDDRARDLQALPARLAATGYRTGVVGDYAADIFTRVRYGFDLVDAPTFNFHALIATRALEKATPLLPLLHSRLGRAVAPAMRELNQAADPHLLARDAIRGLDRVAQDGKPFFLTVFFSTAHFPYAAPAPYYSKFTDPKYRGRFKYHKPNLLGQEGELDDADIRQVRALYDGAVASIDDAAGEILAALKARDLDDNTIVLVTADHGEMLYEAGHGQGHGDHLFGDQVVHVPLRMRLPASLGFGSDHTILPAVRDIDLAPTLLELAGTKVPAGEMDGRSLVPLLRGESLPVRPVFGETEIWMTETIPGIPSAGPDPLRLPYPNVAGLTELDPRLGFDIVMRAESEALVVAGKHRMVLLNNKKLVYVPTRKGARYFLFDRLQDPEEQFDLSVKLPDEVANLKNVLFRWMLQDPKMEEREGLLLPNGGLTGHDGPGMRLP